MLTFGVKTAWNTGSDLIWSDLSSNDLDTLHSHSEISPYVAALLNMSGVDKEEHVIIFRRDTLRGEYSAFGNEDFCSKKQQMDRKGELNELRGDQQLEVASCGFWR